MGTYLEELARPGRSDREHEGGVNKAAGPNRQGLVERSKKAGLL